MQLDYKVNTKENVYFGVRLFISLGLYFVLGNLILHSFDLYDSYDPRITSVYILYGYLFLILVFLIFRFGVLIGYLKGNAIKLSKNQFPEIYEIVARQAEQLGLRSIPSVYILQSGGILNAFAASFLGRNYIVLYSEIVETALSQDRNMLEFIAGHELGHIKRHHMLKKILLAPSYLIPFLGSAYSRACEYTCDNIGYSLCPAGVRSGLLVLASGKTIYKQVNMDEYLAQDETENGFWKWFAEKISSHPNLTKRLALYRDSPEMNKAPEKVKPIEREEEDYSRYMPK